MVGMIEWWDVKPQKLSGFIVVSTKVEGGYRLDRYYFRQSRIKFLAVEKIQKGQFVRFVPGPMPDKPGPGGKPMRPTAHDIEIFESEGMASVVDAAASKMEACHE